MNCPVAHQLPGDVFAFEKKMTLNHPQFHHVSPIIIQFKKNIQECSRTAWFRDMFWHSLWALSCFLVGAPFHIQTQGVRRKSSAFKSPEAFPRLFSCWRLRGGSTAGGVSAGRITHGFSMFFWFSQLRFRKHSNMEPNQTQQLPTPRPDQEILRDQALYPASWVWATFVQQMQSGNLVLVSLWMYFTPTVPSCLSAKDVTQQVRPPNFWFEPPRSKIPYLKVLGAIMYM